jgi:acetoin utilization protein AcuB
MTDMHASIATLMTVDPLIIDPEDGLDTAEDVLRLTSSHEWPVARGRAFLGMITLEDLMLSRQLDGPRASVCCGELINAALFVAGPNDELIDAARQLQRYKLSCLPVAEGGELSGILTLTDFVALAIEALQAERDHYGCAPTVAHLMTAYPKAIQYHDPVSAAESMMSRFGIRHLPVLSDHRVVGIVSDRDVVGVLRSSLELPSSIVVGEIMTANPVTTTTGFTAETAGRLLLEKQIGALPVLRDDRLVGVISKRDFLGYLISRGPSMDIDRIWAD